MFIAMPTDLESSLQISYQGKAIAVLKDLAFPALKRPQQLYKPRYMSLIEAIVPILKATIELASIVVIRRLS
jgi:hypothetical protein